MKILLITHDLAPGGAERLAVDLSNELAKSHEVHLLSVLDDSRGESSFYRPFISEAVIYTCAREKKGFSIRKIMNLCRIVREISPDIVHFHGVLLVFYFILPILFFRKPGYIETLHSRADIVFTPSRLPFLSRLIYKYRLVLLCTISDDNRKSLEKQFNITDPVLIYNGRARPEKTRQYFDVKNEIERLKKSSDDTVFLHVGRCFGAKNQKLLISAFNDLVGLGHSCILVVAGPGFETAQGRELKKIANPENIFFLGPKTNISDYFLCSDAFCLSSLYEGMPITLIEAFACGCVPVSTPVSGAVDLISDGETGFISGDFSKASYLNALIRYMNSKNDIPRSRLIQLFNDKLTIEKCAGHYADLYKSRVTSVSY
ncbi:MAG TPA: glycosyltransferase family 4 protein [Bacteroidales bacterium]|nr:glycosyltransferase family 4 protein [Bacteroidales bacterium]